MKVLIKSKSGSTLTSNKAEEMLHDGTAHGKPLTKKQKRYFGMIAHPKAENGKSITPLDSNTMLFRGPSHEKGGIDIGYSGKKVEVEGDETAYKSPEDDSLHIMGNMINPLSGKKFKEDSKTLAKKDNRVMKFIDKGTELVNNSNPADKWESLTFNSGKAMLSGGIAKKKELDQSKEHLANIQQAMLDTADELGADAQEFSKGKLTKAKYGAKIADNGDELYNYISKRTKPSYGVKNALYNFGNADENAQRTGQPLPVTVKNSPRVRMNAQPAIIGGNPNVQPKMISDPMNKSPFLKFDASQVGQNSPYSQQNNETLQYNPTDTNVGTNATGLSFGQILPELYTAATNKQEGVFMQQFNPQLYSPYSVSFQDRRNQNNASFRALSQRFSDNPQALATLAAQKYEADNQVNAEEFRTNQEISNDITNKNVGLINDAQYKNLALADTQYTRQAQAKANTKQINQSVLKSIADKMHQNELEQKTLKTYENMYNYRFDPATYKAQYVGAPGYEYIDWPTTGGQYAGTPGSAYINWNDQGDAKTINKTDYKGRTSTTKITDAPDDEYSKQLSNALKAEQLRKQKLRRFSLQKSYNSYSPR